MSAMVRIEKQAKKQTKKQSKGGFMNQLFGAACVLTALMWSSLAPAQPTYPSRPVHMIVVYPAGGGADLLARTLGETIQRQTGQPLVVENRAGASGMIGTTACKNAPPDGYTFCLVLSDVVTINPHLFKNIAYDVDKDLVPVASLAETGSVVVVGSTVPAKNLRELADYSNANKDKANWGSFGVGSSSHLMLEVFNKSLGASLTHVPYRGVPQLVTALLTREVDVSILVYGQVSQYLAKGEMKVLASTGARRLPQIPDVPSVAEQGLNSAPVNWYGVFAPTGTPAEVVARMNQLLNESLADPTVRKLLDVQGFFPVPDTPAGFGERVKKDRESWRPVARALNLSLD